MKTKERQDKKTLSLVELRSELRDKQAKQFKLEFKHRVTPLANPIELRLLRRDIARLNTWISQKQSQEA